MREKGIDFTSGKWAVVLISRSLATIQIISAFLEISALPERLISLRHHTDQVSVLIPSAVGDLWRHYYQPSILSILARVAGLLLLTVVFWNCGPWIERALLPKPEGKGRPV